MVPGTGGIMIVASNIQLIPETSRATITKHLIKWLLHQVIPRYLFLLPPI